jgi:hypothetical protein
VLDGVFAEEGAGALRFHPAPPPTDEDMDDVLAAIRRRVRRRLARRGVPEEPGEAEGADPWAEREPTSTCMRGWSCRPAIACGWSGRAGTRCGRPWPPTGSG